MARTNNKCIDTEVGTDFGLWRVTGLSKKWDYLKCVCLACGTEKEVNVYSLYSGKSKSCGCKSLAIRRQTQGVRNP